METKTNFFNTIKDEDNLLEMIDNYLGYSRFDEDCVEIAYNEEEDIEDCFFTVTFNLDGLTEGDWMDINYDTTEEEFYDFLKGIKKHTDTLEIYNDLKELISIDGLETIWYANGEVMFTVTPEGIDNVEIRVDCLDGVWGYNLKTDGEVFLVEEETLSLYEALRDVIDVVDKANN